jgi:catechol 2,3-dioxygenase-like lactoylglutathione lyase family enzyme
MHKSRLAGFIIDCSTPDLQSAAKFWGGALGMELRTLPGEEGDKYVRLVDPEERLHVEVHPARVRDRLHLDIESDDVEAEVRRLEQLGARRVQRVQSWWVMEAPTGQRFCVVEAQGERFAAQARQWK